MDAFRELDRETARSVACRPRLGATIRALWADETGATMVEYGLMVLLIAVACVGGVALFGRNTVLTLFTAATSMPAGL